MFRQTRPVVASVFRGEFRSDFGCSIGNYGRYTAVALKQLVYE